MRAFRIVCVPIELLPGIGNVQEMELNPAAQLASEDDCEAENADKTRLNVPITFPIFPIHGTI
jgi:hypothetical protein